MPPIKREDLPQELRELLDTPAPEGACVSDQPVCTPDDRVTAQLTDQSHTVVVLPWRISNAEEGHLLMVPGGSGGMIGGLLSQIDPPQYYSHMAIMTRDQVEFRQATASAPRLKAFPHYAGTEGDPGVSLKFVPALGTAPTDGFQEIPLRNGWPGTVTQSVENAYLTWASHPMVKDADGKDVPDAAFSALDAGSGQRFFIDDVTFGPVQMEVRGNTKTVHPIIVKPCPTLETDAVRSALSRVARAAEDLRGHYRFYGYTKAAIGMDKDFFGFRTLETEVPDPDGYCTGKRRLIDVIETIPMVCSSFPWLAVQKANAERPTIMLDGRNQGRNPSPLTHECGSFFARQPFIDKIDANTLDGLYFYGKDERLIAARWLHAYLKNDVLQTISESTDLLDQINALFGGSSTAWDIWNILKLLATVSMPQVLIILDISSEVLNELVVLLTDTPDDVATQIANAFANDNCNYTAKDSEAWEMPGEGYAVSPDNIINSWAPPTSEDSENIHGLYGYNERAIVRPPELLSNPPPPSTWQISDGVGSMEGKVTVENVGVHGAKVRVGCRKWVTESSGGFIRQDLPSGKYWAAASYLHPTSGLLLEAKGRPVTITAGGGHGEQFEEPLDSRRHVWFEGHMDLVNRYAVGKDWWGHPFVTMKPAFLGLDYFPDEPEFAVQRTNSLKQQRGDAHKVDDWGDAEVQCDLAIQPDRAMAVTVRLRLKEIPDDPWQHEEVFRVPPKASNGDPGFAITLDVVRSEMAWPVRAHLELLIHNDRAA